MNKYGLFKIYLKDYIKLNQHLLRKGQMLINVLKDFDSNMYKKISESEINCYYNDDNIIQVMSVLKTSWDGEWYEV